MAHLRSSVSAVPTLFQDHGIIRLRHDRMTVVNRAALEKMACEGYRAMKAALREL